MALRDCPECRNPVSTEALTCPHCGHPLQRTQKRRAIRRELLLVLGIVVVFAMFYGAEDPATKKPSPSLASRCDTASMTRLVQQALDGGILHRIDGKPEVSRVYVLDQWARLTIDEKKALDAIVKCTVTHGAPTDRTIVVYHDGRTGKEVATSNRNGFMVE